MFSTTDLLLSASLTLIYLVLAALVFAESAALVGLVLLPTATMAAIAGDTVGYRVGRRRGPAARTSRLGTWVGADRWARGEDLLTRHAVLSVLGGRWVGVLRPLIPVRAGITRRRRATTAPATTVPAVSAPVAGLALVSQ